MKIILIDLSINISVSAIQVSPPLSFSSSTYTDDLSTMGVPVDNRDEVDYLGGVLEHLEPGLVEKRRSQSNLDGGSR